MPKGSLGFGGMPWSTFQMVDRLGIGPDLEEEAKADPKLISKPGSMQDRVSRGLQLREALIASKVPNKDMFEIVVRRRADLSERTLRELLVLVKEDPQQAREAMAHLLMETAPWLPKDVLGY